IYLFARHEASVNWRMLFLNPGILATLVGLIMLFLPFSWPDMIVRTFEDVGKMTVPLSMILIGSLLADTRMDDFKQYCSNLYIWLASLMKLLILPLTLLIFILFGVPRNTASYCRADNRYAKRHHHYGVCTEVWS